MKTTKFITIKKRYVILSILLVFLVVIFSFMPSTIASISPKKNYIVVIDAGHGGIDGGCEGISTGITEASLNLDYAKCLKEMMINFGFDVVMTRNDASGLYSPLASNKKKDDMRKRQAIVKNANADFVISIHMNSYNSTSCGAQVFYGKDDEPSKLLATNIQKNFIKNLTFSRKETKVGDYFMLNEISAPSVLVECGFLSNPKEEALLVTDDYKKEVCYSILLGTLEYLN